MKAALCSLLTACALLAWLPAPAADIPAVTVAELEEALVLGGSNRPQLEAALDWCVQKPFAMQAMRFVIANLPTADLGAITAAQLIENYELALKARQDFPWGEDYDDANWAHYVLAPRISQEPLCDWRKYFFEQALECVKGCTAIEQAAAEVNRWTGARVRFQQTQTRDQNALVTLTSGYGRCEEMVIVYLCCCRALGIPARQAYTPWWATGDNNHAWAEVLGSDGRWHFTGGCEPRPTLDDAWFGESAKSAGLVVSICFGLPEGRPGEAGASPAWADVLDYETAAGARYCRLNSTRYYRRVGALDFRAPPAAADIAAGTRHYITVSLFNYGALRSLCRVPLDGAGRARIELGVGDYAVTCDAPGPPYALAHIEADTQTALEWSSALSDPPERFSLHFPKDP